MFESSQIQRTSNEGNLSVTRSKVLCLVLNYNEPESTVDTVESLLRAKVLSEDILIIDNASQDKSLEIFAQKIPSVPIQRQSQNLGYAGGNNKGLEYATRKGYEFALILNNDICVDPNSITELEKAASIHLNSCLMSPRVMHHDEPSKIDSLGTDMDWLRLKPRLSFFGQVYNHQITDNDPCSILPGSALWVRLACIPDLGYLNEDYFLIHEDAEWSLRSLNKGFVNRVIPSAIVYHKRSQTLSKYPYLSAYYSSRNFLRLAFSYGSGIERGLALLGVLFKMIQFGLLINFASARQKKEIQGFFKGIQHYARNIKGKFPEQ